MSLRSMPYAKVLAAIKVASRPLTLEFEVRTDDFQPSVASGADGLLRL